MDDFEGWDPLALKLRQFSRLSVSDRDAITSMVSRNEQRLPARRDLIREGDNPTHCLLITEGWAYRYKIIENGNRQILGFFLPGDLCDLNVFILKQMDHSIASMSPIKYVNISPKIIYDLSNSNPRIIQAMWWDSLVGTSIQREWTVDLGQRNALERICHLFCELFVRLRSVGLTEGNKCFIPMTQIELSDAMGLTPVHVNRTVREMRERGLVEWAGSKLTILDSDRLQEIGMFNPNYLHLDHEGAHLDAFD